ncbi:MAG TPA: amidohydrolase family protein [Chitinophagaceae bacterium]|nr:amidohydrolase family protein [Chitinophagaceae bacterium]
MPKQWILLFFVLVSAAGSAQIIYAIKDVTIVDVERGTLLKKKSVLVQGNKILSIGNGNNIPINAVLLNGNGKYLLPGLWDMHTHTLRKARLSNFFPLFVANGVTGIRDMASDMPLPEIRQLQKDIDAGTVLGPRLGCYTGRIFDGPPQPDTLLFTYPADTTAARKKVQSHAAQGASFIKVYNMLSPDIYFAIADECKKNNIPFEGHVPFALTASTASRSGQRSIEHLSDLLISVSADEDVIRKQLAGATPMNAIQSSKKRMEVNFDAAKNYSPAKATALFTLFARNETWQCPTLINLQITSTRGYIPLLMSDARIKYFSKALQENWKRSLGSRLTGDSLQRALFFRQSLRLVLEMKKAGVPLLAGTDLSSSFQMPGFSLHDELALMVEAGLSPPEALQTATINPARFLHLEHALGSIATGKLADLLLLDANPLEDITNVKKIAAVFVNGRLLQRGDLDALLQQVATEVQQMNAAQP